jgi:hypothetical protein
MYRISVCFFVALFAVKPIAALAQQDDFCDAITTIVKDAPNKFRNIRGKMIGSNANATMWATGIKVPGTIGDRFVESMGLFYEGVFFQTKKKDELGPGYKKVKAMFTECLTGKGYTMSAQPNFTPGMEEYKKLVFLPAIGKDAKPKSAPPHFTMEVIYSKELKQYTIVMYIFEH